MQGPGGVPDVSKTGTVPLGQVALHEGVRCGPCTITLLEFVTLLWGGCLHGQYVTPCLPKQSDTFVDVLERDRGVFVLQLFVRPLEWSRRSTLFGCWSIALFLCCRTERDASNWSTEKLKTLFLAVRVQNEEGKCEVTEVNKLDGEASINNRKGKLIFFYEWSVKLNWTGESAGLSGRRFTAFCDLSRSWAGQILRAYDLFEGQGAVLVPCGKRCYMLKFLCHHGTLNRFPRCSSRVTTGEPAVPLCFGGLVCVSTR